MKKGIYVLFLGIFALLFLQCAKRGSPTGGDPDTEPPDFIRANPENYSTNFNNDEIRIYFDEYIKLEKPQEQIIISPPMSPKPEISPLGSPQKYIRIRINDTLQENTTYVINFGTSIVDNNEGNPLPFFKYVFSTGTYIDSLTVSGTVEDALLKEPEPFISVMLYERDEDFSDSLVYKEPPRYITNTLDSLTTFDLTNLKEGSYQLVAVQDLNNNYNYDPATEKIGFIEGPVTIPTDTTFNLVLFKEVLPFEAERPKQLAENKILIGYRGRVQPDSISFEELNIEQDQFDYRITKVPEKDSLNLWYKSVEQRDSLVLRVVTPKRVDTLFTRITDLPADSLQITTEPSGNIDFGKDVFVNANTPIVAINESLISITDTDSVNVRFSSELLPFQNSLQLQFPKDENQSYQLTMLPGAIVDFYNDTNDTIKKNFNTRTFADYGNLSLNLENVKSFPVIVQLTSEAGEVMAEQYSTSQTSIRFDFLTPGKYLARVIYDTNENRKWDTGDYLEKEKPEEIVYFPEVLDVRPNWDVNQSFNLN